MSESTDNKSPPIIGWKWWTREVVSIVCWGLIVLAPFAYQLFDKEVLAWVTSAVTVKYVTIAVFLVLGTSWIIGLQTMWHIAFVATYPLILPLRVLPKLCIRHWPILFIFLPGIRGLAKGMRLRAGLFCVAVSATIAAFSFTAKSVLISSWVILCAYLLWVFIHQLYMAFRPATAYSELVDILQKIPTWLPTPKELVAKLNAPPQQKAETKVDEERSRAANLFILYGVSTALHYVARHLEALQKSFKLDIYLVWCVAKTLVLTVTVFTLVFASMGFADSSNFRSESGEQIGLVSYVMFSFCNLMTSEVSGIQTASELARVFACIELVFAFGLLVLILSVVFTSLRDRHRSDLQLVISRFQSASLAISDVFESDFSLTKSAVEGIVLGFAPPISKHLIALHHGKAYAERLYQAHEQTKNGQSKEIDANQAKKSRSTRRNKNKQ